MASMFAEAEAPLSAAVDISVALAALRSSKDRALTSAALRRAAGDRGD
jgi:hypothetical protein